MSITDELREYARGLFNTRETVLAIADRIDEQHQKACDDAWDNGYEADYLGIENWLIEHQQVMEHHGYIELPKDANGERIRIGDVMEWVPYDDTYQPVIRTVSGVGADVFFAWSDEKCNYAQYGAQAYRHHKQPTVEDVLHEFALACEDAVNAGPEVARIAAEYAKRLKLAGEAE